MKSKFILPSTLGMLIASLFLGACNMALGLTPAPVDPVVTDSKPVVYEDLPPIVQDRTAWNCYHYDSGCCPVAGENRNLTFAAYVSDDFGVREVWASYRFIIPEWVRSPLGLSPIYSAWNGTPKMTPITITPNGNGFYEYTFDAAQVMFTYSDFFSPYSLRLMGVDIEYIILANDTTGQTGYMSQNKIMMFCAVSSSPPCAAQPTQTKPPTRQPPAPTSTATQQPQPVCTNYTDMTTCTADPLCYWDTGFQSCHNK